MYFSKNDDKFSKKILTATMAIAIPIMIDTIPTNAEINEMVIQKNHEQISQRNHQYQKCRRLLKREQ